MHSRDSSIERVVVEALRVELDELFGSLLGFGGLCAVGVFSRSA
jgi:hypothetical protein